MERWKIINAHPDYEVSDQGRIRRATNGNSRKRGFVLFPMIRNGYQVVTLDKRDISVHKLVLETWVCKRPPKNEAHHKNGVRHDNRLSNLEWVTHSQNVMDGYRRKNHKMLKAERDGIYFNPIL